ncbi:MAG: caspase family protein [Bacteroidota bacterium]
MMKLILFFSAIIFSSFAVGQDIKLGLPVGHTEKINSISYSPDGKIIVTCSNDHTAKIWDAKTGKLLYSLEGHSDIVNSVNVSSDNERIVTAGDNSAKIWSAQTGKLLFSIEDKNCNYTILSAKFSPDSKTVVTTSKSVKIWDVVTGELLNSLDGHSDWILNANFSMDGKKLVTASSDSTAIIWETSSGRMLNILKGHKGFVQNANFSPDGKRIITASKDNIPRIWDAQSGELILTLEGHKKTWWDYEPFYNGQYSPDGKIIVTASIVDETAKIWDAQTGKLLYDLDDHSYGVFSFSFSPDCKNITISSAGRGQGVKIWDLQTGKLLYVLRKMPKHPNVCYSPDGKTIGVAGDLRAEIYEAKAAKPIPVQISPHFQDGIHSVICSPDNRSILITGDNSTTLWDKNGKLIKTLKVDYVPGFNCIVTNASFSSDGKNIVTSGTFVQLWDSETGELIRDFGGFIGINSNAIFSPDSKYLIIYTANIARLHDVNTGKLIRKFKNKYYDINDLFFSPDGKYLAISYGKGYELENSYLSDSLLLSMRIDNGNELKIWDFLTGKLINSFPENRILAFSPDSKSIFAANENLDSNIIYSDINMYDIQSGETSEISYSSGKISGYEFCKNGNLVLACGNNVKLFLSSNDGNGFYGYVQLKQNEVVPITKCVSYSPNSSSILTSTKGFVYSWNSYTGKFLQSFEAHDCAILGLIYTPDFKNIVTYSEDNIVKIWNSESLDGKIPPFSNMLFDLKGSVKSIETACFSPDGKSILTMEGLASSNKFKRTTGINGEDSIIYNGLNNKIWNIQTGKWEHIFQSKGRYYCTSYGFPVFSRDGKLILTSGGDNSAKIWDSKSGKLVHSLQDTSYFNDYNIISGFAPDGKKVATIYSEIIGEDYRKVGIVKIWDVTTGKLIISINSEQLISSCEFSPDGNKVIISYPYLQAEIWDIQTGKLIGRTSEADSLDLYVAKYSPEGNYIIINMTDKKKTKICDANTGKIIRELNGLSCYGPDGKTIVTWDRKVATIRESLTGKTIHTLSENTEDIKEVLFSTNGSNIFTCSYKNNIKIWNSMSGKLISTYSLKGNFIDIHWGTKRILSTEYSRYILSDLETGCEIVSCVDIDSINWIVTTPSGFFDATPDALKQIYFVKGLEVIPLESYYEQFYRPNLWERVMRGEEIEKAIIDFNNQKPTPELKITNPSSDKIYFRGDAEIDLSTNKIDFILEYTMTDKGGGISEIRIFQNGKLVHSSLEKINNKDESTDRSFNLKLLSGINTIKVTVFNNDRIEKSETTVIEYNGVGQETSKLFVLAIGINEYQKSTYNLNYAVPDATSFKNAIDIGAQDIFSDVIITFIQNSDATKENILKSVKEIQSNCKQGDVFVLYYAGHGSMSVVNDGESSVFYLIPYELTNLYNDEILKKNGISAGELQNISKEIKAQKQLFILDACQSGGAVNVLANRGAVEEKAMAILARSTGTYFLTASGSEQLAGEFASLGHGVFTFAILQGLSGQADANKDGKISIKELSLYVENKVPELSEKYKGASQFPVSYGFGQDFPLVINGKFIINESNNEPVGKYSGYSTKELENMKKEAVEMEDFDLAKELKNEIEKRMEK